MKSDDLEGSFAPLDDFIDALYELSGEHDDVVFLSVDVEYTAEASMSGIIPVTTHFELDTADFDPTIDEPADKDNPNKGISDIFGSFLERDDSARDDSARDDSARDDSARDDSARDEPKSDNSYIEYDDESIVEHPHEHSTDSN